MKIHKVSQFQFGLKLTFMFKAKNLKNALYGDFS